jgi:hypothetical protein
VSAEVFGTWNKKKEFQAPKYEKAPSVRDALKKRLEQAFMFSSLSPEDLSVILDAMQSVKKKAGDSVITEGEEGDCLYVVESGVLTCTKVIVSSTLTTAIEGTANLPEGVQPWRGLRRASAPLQRATRCHDQCEDRC